MITKPCSKCSQIKPLEDFNKAKRASDGRTSECKECERQRKGSVKRHAKITIVDGVSGKECSECKEWKCLDEYMSSEFGKGGKLPRCTPCHYAINSVWVRENKDKRRVVDQRRSARKSELPVDLTQDDIEEVKRAFNYSCALTGDTADIHLDHVIPINAGFGGTVRGNMIPLRGDLNRSKRDHNIFDWFSASKERYGLPQDKFDYLIGYLAESNGMTTDEYRNYTYGTGSNR